jgi:hypothetical protein
MSITYAHEKLTQAIYGLATGAGRIQERLHQAYMAMHTLKRDDLPDGNMRRKLAGVMDDLTYQPAKGHEGQITATLAITNDEDAREIARRIVDLFLEVRDLDKK